jgi:hypothetical protein
MVDVDWLVLNTLLETDDNIFLIIFLYVCLRFVINVYHLIFNLIQETCNSLSLSLHRAFCNLFK